MLFDLAGNAAILIVLGLLYRLIARHVREHPAIGPVVTGLLFGGAALVGMTCPVVLEHGFFFDARTVVLSISALFGGPVAAAISGAMAAGYRLWIGGHGLPVGLFSVAFAVLVGLSFRYFLQKTDRSPSLIVLPIMGLIVNLPVALLFTQIETNVSPDRIASVIVSYCLIMTTATLVMGYAISHIEKAGRYDEIVQEMEMNYESFFQLSATPFLSLDASRFFRRNFGEDRWPLSRLKSRKMHAQQLMKSVGLLQISAANQAALKLLGAKSVREINQNMAVIAGLIPPTAFEGWFHSLARGDASYELNLPLRTLDNHEVRTAVSIAAPRSRDAFSRLSMTIVDMTEILLARQTLQQQHDRLSEVVWGASVGTWEWVIPTGEVHFNEKWAELVGYTLADLEPVSIDTWYNLIHPDDRKVSEAALEKTFDGTAPYYEAVVRMRHRDGYWIWVLDRGNVVEWSPTCQPIRMSGTHTEITAQKTAELRLERLTDFRSTLMACNTIMLEAEDEAQLYRRTVEELVHFQSYTLGWIGVPQHDTAHTVRPVASAGRNKDYLDHIKVHWSDDELGNGPTGRAIRTGEIQVASDIPVDPNFGPWAGEADRHHLRSSVAAPVQVDGKVVAVVNLYSNHSHGFDEDEIRLIADFCHDLGRAVQLLRVRKNQRHLQVQLRDAAFGAIRAISATIEKRDPYTSGHQANVAEISVAIGRKLGWSEFRLEGLRLGASIHDIGKIYIPSEILNRPGRLTPSEFEMIKTHPQVGHEILERTWFPWPIKEMIIQHHERIDGSGYPAGLKGEQIIAEARVIAVADVLDAITSHRPYRPGKGIEVALEEIERGRGTAYDPEIADTCLDLVRNEHFIWGSVEAI